MNLLRELSVLVGSACVIGGLWGYDWRLALIVAGVVLVVSGAYGIKNHAARISRHR